ncbi:hypothetical protein PB1_01925 [Bacillus methanolicus PB1]|uniref:Uncharacterized protein n=1 Tax=Bacillus methanolicus PB1 TaxID=997296 RepID=I3E589_BACMT|nr:hypothetical protein PB1_01925 [Bacillus methanolicus PB1]
MKLKKMRKEKVNGFIYIPTVTAIIQSYSGLIKKQLLLRMEQKWSKHIYK